MLDAIEGLEGGGISSVVDIPKVSWGGVLI